MIISRLVPLRIMSSPFLRSLVVYQSLCTIAK